MLSPEALLDIHRNAHQNLGQLLAHAAQLSSEELNRAVEGFGYPTVRLQFHHEIGAERYWVGVILGKMEVDDDSELFTGIPELENLRQSVSDQTQSYLKQVSSAELNQPRSMTTWGNQERQLVPSSVILRTITHLYHHQGQILAMCRLLGKPGRGFDYPLT